MARTIRNAAVPGAGAMGLRIGAAKVFGSTAEAAEWKFLCSSDGVTMN